MNQMLPSTVIDDLMSLLPTKAHRTVTPAGVLSRTEKLLHWAQIIRRSGTQMYLFHLLERQPPDLLPELGFVGSAFHLAGADPVLQGQGIKQDLTTLHGQTTSVAEVMRFFDLSQEQLHEFSCNCGGNISNEEMAGRVEGIARAG